MRRLALIRPADHAMGVEDVVQDGCYVLPAGLPRINPEKDRRDRSGLRVSGGPAGPGAGRGDGGPDGGEDGQVPAEPGEVQHPVDLR